MTDRRRPTTSPQLVATIELSGGPVPLWLSTVNWMDEAQKWKALARKHEATSQRLARHIRHLILNTSGARREGVHAADTPDREHTTEATSDQGHIR